jgi:hypothetical protein
VRKFSSSRPPKCRSPTWPVTRSSTSRSCPSR